ncbi:MAG: aminoglycoside 3'-phosphotransferase/choline kinase family protein [Bradyrhizobium sp.]|uniref:aminoglycoside phosphotransferase family protein n=1 Tax=Bradyrhizobium sp. TaxID=376 RepID=UPI001D406F47|nr:aminoglycoside 3'-phosphotransferase/choline kinase family protein [Bradyrhizobium sp.]MBV9560039.1 aminoglycoside 3'-phosphotransferase/choline kinase family protein [Bradyrhizobium sp.]
MTASLPDLADFDSYRTWRADPARWLSAAIDIARGHRVAANAPRIFSTGTNLVVALDDRLILKIFPPMLRPQFVSECASLSVLHGRLHIPIPEIIAAGERDGWPYLITTRLSGVLGAEAWPRLSEADKESVLGEIGQTIAAVQRVPPGDLLRIEPAWPDFMRRQIAGCRTRHERLGLPGKFLDGLDGLLGDAASLIPMDAPPVILTGEYIPENFLLNEQGGRWRVAGLFDFGDVLTGWRDYDLLGPSAFMAAGRARRVRSLLEGFGYSGADIDFTLKRRLMALMLLHRASDPLKHICIDGWQHQAGDLIQLQELIWPN